MAYAFHGGAHPDGAKELTCGKAIEKLKLPDEVILPISMHIGAPCEPLVKVGDIVDLGQKIADSDKPVSAPVHASVSGEVVAIEPRPHPNGTMVQSIVIRNDGEDRWHPSVQPREWENLSADELADIVHDAGIVGHGGAAFPTHIKIRSGIGKIDKLIINAAECEPYITSDHRLLLERPEETIKGIEILLKIFGLPQADIGLETNKQDVLPGLYKAIGDRKDIVIHKLRPKYPQGAEKQLIYAITKREVPSGKLPADAGAAVFNVDTCGAIYRAVALGMPVIRRIVTVSGSAVASPRNLEVRIGTPLKYLFEAAGGFEKDPTKILMGGPMMGVAQFTLEPPVIKGTNAILAFSEKETKTGRQTTCIRCGKCVASCPMKLLPTYLYLFGEKDQLDKCEKYGVLDCIECGACTFVCPARLDLTQSFRKSKQRILEARRKQGGAK